MKRGSGTYASAPSKAGRVIEDIYTLSPVQQGMLFHILSNPGQSLYFDQTVCHLRGRLELGAFRRAWNEVLRRHGVLRTGFQWEGLSKPVQVVLREVDLEFQVMDWTGLSRAVMAARMKEFLREERQRGLDLSNPPLFRLRLFLESEDSYRLVWSVSHLLVDAWASAVVLEEVVRIYEATRRREAPDLLPPVRYREYVSWVKRLDLGEAERFWRRYLDGWKGPLALASQLGSNEEDGSDYRRESFSLDPECTEALRELARRHELTVNTVAQGCWALLLALSTNRQDLVFGVTSSGRSLPLQGVEQMVGPLVNTLPVRVVVEPEEELLPWLRKLQEQQLELRQFEHTSLQRVVSWASPGGARSLFESLFVFLNITDLRNRRVGSLRLDDLSFSGRPHYPLCVTVVPGRSLTVELSFDVKRFAVSTIHSWLERFRALLVETISAPRRRVAALLEAAGRADRERKLQQRERRRDSNSDRLRDTKPIPIRLSREG